MNHSVKMGLYFTLIAAVWIINSMIIASLSTWMIHGAVYFFTGFNYLILAFITGYLFAKIVETARDIFRQSV